MYYIVKSYWDMRKIPLPKDKLYFPRGIHYHVPGTYIKNLVVTLSHPKLPKIVCFLEVTTTLLGLGNRG